MGYADTLPVQQCIWLNTPLSFTWAPGPEGLLQLGPSQQHVPGDCSTAKLNFLGLNFRISPVLSKFQLSGFNSSLARSCFQLHTCVKHKVKLCSAILPWAELLHWMLCLPLPPERLEGFPQNSPATHSPVLHWDVMRLHAVWLLCGWETVWMRFIHCNQNPTSTGRKFKCMRNNLSKKLAKAAYFSCLTRSYAIKWLITHGTVWEVKD